jgi:hypothetical protein
MPEEFPFLLIRLPFRPLCSTSISPTVDCDRCENSRTLTGFEVAQMLGTGELQSFRQRFKCSLCGARQAKLIVVTLPPRRN